MHNMYELISDMCSLLEHGEGFVLATILSHAGSTPRTAGAKMVVRSDGSIIGTIGGGWVEAEVIRAAMEVFGGSDARLSGFELAGSLESSTDLVCGGRLEVLIGPIDAHEPNLALFRNLQVHLKERRRCLLVTDLGAAGAGPGNMRLFLIAAGQAFLPDFPYPAHWMEEIRNRAKKESTPFLQILDGHRFFVEPCALPGTVLLFGAGHVSQQVSFLTERVGFRTVVIDDRSEFANRERFPAAEEVIVLDSFEQAFSGLEVGRDSYVIIATRGHSHDRTVLEQALRTRAGYIGMMGSRRKRDTLYEALIRSGFRREDLERVHCPIGLPIGAEGPEEIAVSIVAELILLRSRAQASWNDRNGQSHWG
ncbi:MAG: XdhC family aldehyde oxidoreductase maturation factor [bacterium]